MGHGNRNLKEGCGDLVEVNGRVQGQELARKVSKCPENSTVGRAGSSLEYS